MIPIKTTRVEKFFSSLKLLQKTLNFNQVEGDVLFDSELNSLTVLFESCPTGFAYLWNETPVLGDQGLAIYGYNEFKLPAAPWKKEVVLTRTLELVP